MKDIPDGPDLIRHAEGYRIRYNAVRPREALAWNRQSYADAWSRSGVRSERPRRVGELHRQIDRDTAGVVPGATRPSAQRLRESSRQTGGISKVSQQSGPGFTDHSTAVSRDDELGTRPGQCAHRKCLPAGLKETLDKHRRPTVEGTFAFPLKFRTPSQVKRGG